MKNLQTIVSGFGGQGILFMGKIIAASGLLDGKEVSWLPSYGPEMRGGTANCSVCVSDVAIGSPLVTAPDVLIALNGPSYDKFIDSVVPDGVVIVDETLVPNIPERKDISFFALPATNLANEENLANLANMILLGKMLKETNFTTLETVTQALEQSIPASKKELLDPNLRAISLGMSL